MTWLRGAFQSSTTSSLLDDGSGRQANAAANRNSDITKDSDQEAVEHLQHHQQHEDNATIPNAAEPCIPGFLCAESAILDDTQNLPVMQCEAEVNESAGQCLLQNTPEIKEANVEDRCKESLGHQEPIEIPWWRPSMSRHQQKTSSSWTDPSRRGWTGDHSTLIGIWQGDRGETYDVHAQGSSSLTCVVNCKGDVRTFDIEYDENHAVYWWGAKKYFINASEVVKKPGYISWYAAGEWYHDKPRPAFTWQKFNGADSVGVVDKAEASIEVPNHLQAPPEKSHYHKKSSSVTWTDRPLNASNKHSCLIGKWKDANGEMYSVHVHDNLSLTCSFSSRGATQTIDIEYDDYYNVYWWGYAKKYFINASEVVKSPNDIWWYVAEDWYRDKKRSSFTWQKLPEGEDFKAFDEEQASNDSSHHWQNPSDNFHCTKKSSDGWSNMPESHFNLTGMWQGDKGEKYHVQMQGTSPLTCFRKGNGRGIVDKPFTIKYDEYHAVYWWGLSNKYFLDASEVLKKPGRISWYAGGDLHRDMKKSAFDWKKLHGVDKWGSS